MVTMIQRLVGGHIVRKFIPSQDHLVAHVDRGRAEQILMNLCVNARDAMGDSGTLTIEISDIALDSELYRENMWAHPGKFVVLKVSDTGSGMDEQCLTNIFEPFFTTKPLGKGTGLGLSIVFGIVSENNGLVDVKIEPGNGATFTIYIPAVDIFDEPEDQEIEEEVRGGKETILLVDDDEMVRKVEANMLSDAGYTVFLVPRCGGEETITIINEKSAEINLLIQDVVMPKVGGKVAAGHAMQTKLDILLLFTSGYSRDNLFTNFTLGKDIKLLQKPFQHDGLLRKVRELLDNPKN